MITSEDDPCPQGYMFPISRLLSPRRVSAPGCHGQAERAAGYLLRLNAPKLIVVRSRLAPGRVVHQNRTSVTPAPASPDQTEQAAGLGSGATAVLGDSAAARTPPRRACSLKIKIS